MGVPLYLNSQASKSSLAKENYQQRGFVNNKKILAYRKCVQKVHVLLATISSDSESHLNVICCMKVIGKIWLKMCVYTGT